MRAWAIFIRGGDISVFDRFWQDIRFGCRLLRKGPGFTLATVLCLAVGMGRTRYCSASSTRPSCTLNVDAPERLVEFHAESDETPTLSYADFVALGEKVGSLTDVPVTSNVYLSARLPDREEIIKGSVVSSNFFDVLGRSARHGEVFHAVDHDRSEGRAVVVLSDGFWRDEYRSDPSVMARC